MDFFNDIFHNLALLEFYFLNIIYILLYIDFILSIIFKHSNILTRASHHWCLASNIVLVVLEPPFDIKMAFARKAIYIRNIRYGFIYNVNSYNGKMATLYCSSILLGPDSIWRCHFTSIGNLIVVRSPYLHNRISCTGKIASLYWIRDLLFIIWCMEGCHCDSMKHIQFL